MTLKNYLPKFIRHQQSESSWALGATIWDLGHLKTGHIGAGRLGAILIKNRQWMRD